MSLSNFRAWRGHLHVEATRSMHSVQIMLFAEVTSIFVMEPSEYKYQLSMHCHQG